MNQVVPKPQSHDRNLLEAIDRDLQRICEEQECQRDRAFLELCVQYFGFTPEHGRITDGSNDFGIDFIEYSGSGATIIQSKTIDAPIADAINIKATPSHITDLPRIHSIISSIDTLPVTMASPLRRILSDLRSVIISSSNTEPFPITVYFCFLGGGFTSAAQAEFENITTSQIVYGKRGITLKFIPIFLPNLIAEKWRESNTRWCNKDNQTREQFDIAVRGNVIRGSKSAVFFALASDLVAIYKEIGYQCFEANVRCEIKNSSVNKAIKASLLTHKGRNEFKHLNNGITMICDSFSNIGNKDKPTGFRVKKPGIINGLQTIKTMSDSSVDMTVSDMEHFRGNCEILVRLHTQNSVSDYRELVKSTNNQNPMKPRNLRSNEGEQVAYERLMADFGWFYERKEGAWSAFNSDPRSWSTLQNKKPTDFKAGKAIRKLDNEEVAQAWISFIGFSDQAVDKKRFLFQDDKLYDLAFKLRTARHGAKYGFRISNEAIFEDSTSDSPNPQGLLAAYLLREFAKNIVKSRKDTREESVVRLGVAKLDRSKQEAALSEDHEYLKDIILRGMLLLFVDFFGYCFFEAFGGDVHEKFGRLLQNGSMKKLFFSSDFFAVKTDYYEGIYDVNDVLLVVWEFYNHCVMQLVASQWLAEWNKTANRSKFIYGDATRKPLIAEADKAEKMFKRGLVVQLWTSGINASGGINEFLRDTLS